MDNSTLSEPTAIAQLQQRMTLSEPTAIAQLQQRMEAMELVVAKLISEEHLHQQRMMITQTLGLNLVTMGEGLLAAISSKQQFQAVPVSESNPENHQTFYASRKDGDEWALTTPDTEGELKPFDLQTVVPNMQTAIRTLLQQQPAGVNYVPFNVFRSN